MAKYAESTEVSSDRSRAEIEKTLARYGASKFMYGWEEEKAVIGFVMSGRQIKFVLTLPDRSSRDITHTPERGTLRSKEQQERVYEQTVRQRWRALALLIKAKLEAIEDGISVFESEFLNKTVLPNGMTVEEYMLPQVEKCYLTAKMPSMLPMLEAGE